jgi:DNA-binding NarL/FixJ family response regulator
MAKRILSVDDHGIISKGLEMMAERVRGGAVVVGVRDGAAALGLVRAEAWDLVVLDIGLQGKSGLEVLKEIKQTAPKVPVLIFSLHTSVEFVRRALSCGASGYVSKDSSDAELIGAIDTILAGGKYVGAEFRDELIFNPQAGAHSDLSAREFEVLIKIGEGQTTREIAAGLHLSESTVETYRLRIREKMGMKRDAELIRYCIGAGLVKTDPPCPAS